MENDGRLAVIGLGSVGSMALWNAVSGQAVSGQAVSGQAGGDVVGFEAHTPGHGRSAVGGDTRLFRMLYRGAPDLYPILERSRHLWDELEQDSGQQVLIRCGGLSIGTVDGPYIPALLSTTAATGAAHELLSRDAMAERYPQHHLRADDTAVFDPHAGALRTDRAVAAAITAARARGASVQTGVAVESIHEDDTGVTVTSANGSWRFDSVIVAAGGWSQRLLPDWTAAHTHPRRIYLSWFVARDPADFAPERFPVFIRISGDRSMYGAPSVDGATVKATLDGRSAPTPDPDTLRRDLTAAETAETLETVTEFFPGLVPSIVRSDAWPDLYTDDQDPMVGPIAPGSRIHCATGCSGAGFKIAVALGEIAARGALGRPPVVGADHLRPDRFRSAQPVTTLPIVDNRQ